MDANREIASSPEYLYEEFLPIAVEFGFDIGNDPQVKEKVDLLQKFTKGFNGIREVVNKQGAHKINPDKISTEEVMSYMLFLDQIENILTLTRACDPSVEMAEEESEEFLDKLARLETGDMPQESGKEVLKVLIKNPSHLMRVFSSISQFRHNFRGPLGMSRSYGSLIVDPNSGATGKRLNAGYLNNNYKNLSGSLQSFVDRMREEYPVERMGCMDIAAIVREGLQVPLQNLGRGVIVEVDAQEGGVKVNRQVIEEFFYNWRQNDLRYNNRDFVKKDDVDGKPNIYSKEMPTVQVDIADDLEYGQLIVRIRDNGPGWPPEIIEKGFEEGNSVNPDGAEAIGQGIGMYGVVKDLERTGAKIKLRNWSLNGGSGAQMTVFFPLEEV